MRNQIKMQSGRSVSQLLRKISDIFRQFIEKDYKRSRLQSFIPFSAANREFTSWRTLKTENGSLKVPQSTTNLTELAELRNIQTVN